MRTGHVCWRLADAPTAPPAADLNDRTRFTVDQPSTVFASFGEPAIAEYGADLDRQLADLLSAFGVEATRFSRWPRRYPYR